MECGSGSTHTRKLRSFWKTFPPSLKETQKGMISSPLDIGISRCETSIVTGNHEGTEPEDVTNELKMAEKQDEKNPDHF